MAEQMYDPVKTAEYFAIVENSNFLAHSIRMIENEFIKKGGVPYRIYTNVSTSVTHAVTLFFKDSCIINLPLTIDERKTRFELGHELGHIVFRFDDLMNAKAVGDSVTSEEEEIFAWEFAYSLIKTKSEQHKDNKQIGRFIYKDDELKTELLSLINDKSPTIIAKVTEHLKL